MANALGAIGHAPEGLKHLARLGAYVKYQTELPERMPIEGLPPKGTVVHTALVTTPRGPEQEFHAVVCPAPTARAAGAFCLYEDEC